MPEHGFHWAGLRLDGGGETLLLRLTQSAPALAYWGPSLPPDVAEAHVEALLGRVIPPGGLDGGEVFDLFPEAGRGFTGHPALEVHRAGQDFVTQLDFVESRPIADGCEIVLADRLARIEVVLAVRVDPDTGVAAFASRLTNHGQAPLFVDWLAAAALPTRDDEVMMFDGRWGREFQTIRERVATGMIVKENRTGRTSHHAPPFLAVGAAGFSHEAGEVLGVHLAWSGDHRMAVERLRDGRVQVQAGELFLPGEMILGPGEVCATPTLYAARSMSGLNGLSDRFHPFVRRQILGGRLEARPRPVTFNTWEAVYFDHDLATLKGLADLAAAVGAERFVLDDGWFEGRNDDTSSLGDWTPDQAKYPHGLAPLIDHVRGLGLSFGLWVEPEMASARSRLLAAHPDWTLHAEGRVQPLGRGQFVLDLARPQVADAIFGQLDKLLRTQRIDYLKWDMNRDLTHAASGGRPAVHRRTLATYALIDRLRAAHPGVEIESCASGGGRADFAILRRTDRIWTSDANDPIERQTIQRGFSIVFPPEVMGAHVGAAADHTTGRRTSLTLRAFTAFFGHMGIEADIRAFSETDRAQLEEAIALHKRFRPLLHSGRTLRLDATDPGAAAFMVVGEADALVSYAQLATPATASLAPLRLPGLDPDRTYAVRLLTPPPRRKAPAILTGEARTTTGRLLAQMGLPLPVLRAGEIAVFHLGGGAV